MLPTFVFLLALTLSGLRANTADLAAFAVEVDTVVASEGGLFEGVDGDLKTASLLTVFAFEESSFQKNMLGDHGRSIGVMQISRASMQPSDAAAVLSNREYGLRMGLRRMKFLIATCHSLPRGLGAYVSGRCGGAPRMVEHRCREASLDCATVPLKKEQSP